jgi:hypothetical protein
MGSSDGIWNSDKEWLQAQEFYCQIFPDDAPKLTAKKMGVEEWSDEKIKEYESEYGPGVDERWVQAMFNKEVGGPLTAIVNARMSGKGITEEQLKWLQSPLPPLNPTQSP